MNYDYAIERYDYNRIDKLNTIIDLSIYWREVKKLTRNVTSDHAIGRWQCLAEARFEELKKQTLDNYNKISIYLSNELSASYFNNIILMIKMDKISELPTDKFGNHQLNMIYELNKIHNQLKTVGLI